MMRYLHHAFLRGFALLLGMAPIADAGEQRVQVSVSVRIDPQSLQAGRWQAAVDEAERLPEAEERVTRAPPPGFRLRQPEPEDVRPVLVLEPEI